MSSPKAVLKKGVALSISRPKVIIADDDADFLDGAREYFSSCDVDVSTAKTPEEAEKILKESKENGDNEFDLVATDVNFGELSETKGDEFVRDSQQLIGNTKSVLFSGEISEEERRQLEDDGYPVLVKSRDLTQKLAAIVQEENNRKRNEIEEVLKNETAPRIKELTGREIIVELLSDPPSPPFERPVFDHLKRTLIKWLRSRSEPDEPILAYGKHVYSPNDMILEVERETEVGIEHVQMLIKVFENSLRLESNDDEADEDDEDDDSQGIEENDSRSHDDAGHTSKEE